MRQKQSAQVSGLAKRQVDREVILVPGRRRRPLTLEDLERACLPHLTRLVADTALWRSKDYGTGWKVGDYNILIVETTVARDAMLYVQFWSEPQQPVLWEVSSGKPQPGARRFVTAHARRALREMGFELGGKVGNYGKQVGIGNRGDAASAARDVLRIHWEAFGYRGGTPLVARIIRGERAERGVFYTRFDPDDVVNLLVQNGYQAEVKKRERRPVILSSRDGFGFAVTLDVPAPDGCFTCLDVSALIGHASPETEVGWTAAVNEVNGRSRVVRAWIDGDGDVIAGTNIMCGQGVTADYVVEQIGGWMQSATALAVGPGRREDEEAEEPEGGASDGETPAGKSGKNTVVH